MGTENPKQPPVAVRVMRPYASEDAFIDGELDTVTRTGVVLLGTQSRPSGVVLRFELALESGVPLLRGEGRVVSYKIASGSEPSALTLRFTRLDTKSKALVDRIAALREERARQALQAAMGESSMPPARASLPPERVEIPPISVPVITDSSPLSLGADPAPPSEPSPYRAPIDESIPVIHAPAADSSGVLEAEAPSSVIPVVVMEPAPLSAPGVASAQPASDPARSGILDRLRERSKNLSPDRVREIQEIGQRLRRA